jgi:hypothetical protein
MRHALLVLLAASLTGCPTPPPRYPITDPMLALRALRARDARVRLLRAHGSADHFGAQGRIRGEVWVFVRRPASLRVDTRAFGTTVSTVTLNNNQLALADFRGGRFFVGPAQPCVAAQLLGIPLESAEVVSMLSGGPPLIDGTPSIAWRDGRYEVDIRGEGGVRETLRLEIPDAERSAARPEDQHPRPVRAELRDARGLRAVLEFGDYTEVNGVPFAQRVRVLMERDNVDLLVRYREITLDPELPEEEDIFSQTAPAAMQEIAVDCDANRLAPEQPADAGAPTDAGATDAGAHP